MDELIKLVSDKTGLSQEMAKLAVETVVGYIKKKLPAPVGSQIDTVLGGAGQVTSQGGLAQVLKGFFGRK
jgi:hypothetical protein